MFLYAFAKKKRKKSVLQKKNNNKVFKSHAISGFVAHCIYIYIKSKKINVYAFYSTTNLNLIRVIIFTLPSTVSVFQPRPRQTSH